MGPAAAIRRRPTTVFGIFGIALLVFSFWVWRKDTSYWNELYVTKLVKAKLFAYRSLSVGCDSTKRMKNPGLILDTPGCRIPKLDPFDPSVIELYEAKDPFICDGPPLLLSTRPGGSIVLNETVLEIYYNLKPSDINCTYEGIRRKYEKPGNVRENDYDLLQPKPLQFGVPIEEDQVRVECSLYQKESFIHYFPLVRLKDEIEKQKISITKPEPKLNIIVTGVDSISKLNFLRHFKKTHAFLKEKNFFDIKGYTKVGDNTFPNLTPLLTGRHIADIWNETIRDTMYFDDVDMIWKRFSKKGYRTFYAEDSPFFGTFNYGRRGFNVTPADYYNRPLYLAMHNSEVRKKGSFYCFNSQLESDVIYNHLRDFVQTMGPRPYFAFAMESSLTHDYLNYAGYADYPLINLLEDLWDYGTFNNTVIVLFGDHGLRFGSIRNTYLGKFEERMPFMYIHFPAWFLEQHPRIANNLRQNQERLVTLFDIHATLAQLLDPLQELSPEEWQKSSPYGLSLMGDISPYRTCEKATIFPHWCTCQVLQEVSVNDKEVIKSSNLIRECINNELRNQACPILEIDRISNAKLGQINDIVLRFVDHGKIVIDRYVTYGDRIVKYEDYLITLVTKPEGRMFESTVRHDVVEDVYCVVDIYELNACEQKSVCVNTQKLKAFKYCNS